MAGTKLSVSMDRQLAKQIRREARASRLKMSSWITEVLREHLRQKEAKNLLADLDTELGAVLDEHAAKVKKQWPED
ncbi:MAG: hypothetical protein H0T89_10870 [Deltaproteobacteria bacterium]|nr:hypothetical protein [Deltaproteobacteria bacterium]MDQ3299937.1 hypothetical protein [Myxococcota bacterium]